MQIEKVESTLNGDPIKCGHFNSSMYDSYIEFPVNLDTGKKYTIHGYIKSSVAGQISCEDATSNVSTEWSHVVMTITPSQQKSLELKFYPGEFWIYEWKLEVGEVNSNWTPSPLDAKYDLISLGSEVKQLSDSITQKVWKEDINDATKEINKSMTTIGQNAEKIYWLIDKNSETQASMSLTSDLYKLVAKNINLAGKVTFESFSSAMQENWNDLKDIANDASDKASDAADAVNNSISKVTTEYYKSTSSEEPLDGKWSEESPLWENGYFIWSRTVSTNLNGDNEVSEPVCITGNDGYTPKKGVDYFDGSDGKDGTSNYIWIRYASDSNGSNMTSTPSSSTIYIGTCVTTSTTAPTSSSQYVWSKYVGSDGIPGTNGVDGKTTYLHIAYANSADGKTGFDISNGNDKKYIGQYTDTTIEDSTDPSKYTWSLIKGIGISSIISQYYLSSSSTELKDGSWVDNESPTWVKGKYIWTRSKFTWDNSDVTTTTAVLAKALNSANENAVTAWNTTQDIIKNIYVTNKTTINGGRIETGTVTADAIAADAIVSKNYVKDSTGSFLNLADGSFDSKYLKWDSTGAITATSGNIGGLSLKNGVLSSQTEAYLLPDSEMFLTFRSALAASSDGTVSLPLSLYDFNCDGVIDILDFGLVGRYLLGYSSEEDFKKWNYSKSSPVTFEINPQNANKAIYLNAEDMWGKERKTQIGIGNIYSNEIECINIKIKDPLSHSINSKKVDEPIEILNYRDTSDSTNIDYFGWYFKIKGCGMLIVNCSIWNDTTSDYGTTSCAIYIDGACVSANRNRTDVATSTELDAGCSFVWWFNDDSDHTLEISAGSTKNGTKTFTQSIQALFGLSVFVYH